MRLASARRTRSPCVGPSAAPGHQHPKINAPSGPFAIVSPTNGATKLAFGAICPAKGKGARLVMPYADSRAMNEHLAEISANADPGAHAVILMDQAGWHTTPKLEMPDNISLITLPPRAQELNQVENIWQFNRDNWLSNRVFGCYEDIVALCCEAWNKLIDRPWSIRTIGRRE